MFQFPNKSVFDQQTRTNYRRQSRYYCMDEFNLNANVKISLLVLILKNLFSSCNNELTKITLLITYFPICLCNADEIQVSLFSTHNHVKQFSDFSENSA